MELAAGGDAFSEGLAVVGVKQLYGYISKDGSFAIEPKYVLATPFSEGAARVIERGGCLYTGYGPCAAFNLTVLPMDTARGNLASRRCSYSFIDKQGTRLFKNEYLDAKDFSEGIAPVGDGKLWGYIDRKGITAIPMKFDDAEPFAEGLARAYAPVATGDTSTRAAES